MYLFCINILSNIDVLHVTTIMDNLFSSVPFCKIVRRFGIFIVGSQRSDRKKYPPALKDKALLKILKR